MRNNNINSIYFLLILMAISGFGRAQNLRLNGYAAYLLDGTYNIYYENGDYYRGKINGGVQLGLGMEYLITPYYGIELSSLRSFTQVFPENDISSDRRTSDLMFNYFLLGINTYPKIHSEKIQAFGGASLGVIVQSALGMNNMAGNTVERSITKFAWGAKVGGIYWLSTQFGLKLQAQWLSALQFKNALVNFDVHGIGIGPVAYTIANQFGLGSGFVIKLGRQAERN